MRKKTKRKILIEEMIFCDGRQMKLQLNSLSTSRMADAETKSSRPTDINLFQVIFDSKCKSFIINYGLCFFR